MGVTHRGRWQFWKFLCRAGVSYPRAFNEAFELAIRGYHFRIIAGEL